MVCGHDYGREETAGERGEALAVGALGEPDAGRTSERVGGAVSRRSILVVARFQTPALRFAGTALVLQPGYGNGGAAYVVSGPKRRREVFAGRQAARLRAQAQSLCASRLGRGRRTSARARGERERQG